MIKRKPLDWRGAGYTTGRGLWLAWGLSIALATLVLLIA